MDPLHPLPQAFTFPLHSRALDTGVSDRTKGGEATAGGFGDGFKTAAISLLAQSALDAAMTWTFETEGRRVQWEFVGAAREAVGTFRASKVLEVAISNRPAAEPAGADGAALSASRLLPHAEQWMLQVVRAKGIGAAFVREAMPRLQVTPA